MKLIAVCRQCGGEGRTNTAIPFYKRTCSSCNGTGKLVQTLAEYRGTL
ncbi:MAG TPA: hypothetical protein VNM45_18220 [Bacillus sp. (in: firmicutes)]|nr:hypothetical protein [Bacillus sp. (in: firmicutes)]